MLTEIGKRLMRQPFQVIYFSYVRLNGEIKCPVRAVSFDDNGLCTVRYLTGSIFLKEIELFAKVGGVEFLIYHELFDSPLAVNAQFGQVMSIVFKANWEALL